MFWCPVDRLRNWVETPANMQQEGVASMFLPHPASLVRASVLPCVGAPMSESTVLLADAGAVPMGSTGAHVLGWGVCVCVCVCVCVFCACWSCVSGMCMHSRVCTHVSTCPCCSCFCALLLSSPLPSIPLLCLFVPLSCCRPSRSIRSLRSASSSPFTAFDCFSLPSFCLLCNLSYSLLPTAPPAPLRT